MECIKKPSHNHRTGYSSDGCRCDECKAAISEYNAEWYRKNPYGVRRRMATRRYKNQVNIQRVKLERGCDICGYDKNAAALHFHHHNKDKAFNIGWMGTSSLEAIMNEIGKCQLLCANCHAEVHHPDGF